MSAASVMMPRAPTIVARRCGRSPVIWGRVFIVSGVPRQLPAALWMSGKNRSFHDAGFFFVEPTLFMNSAYFMVFCGTSVYCTCGLDNIVSYNHSPVSLLLVDSAQICAAARLSLFRMSVASCKAENTALYILGLASRNFLLVQITVKVCGPPMTS